MASKQQIQQAFNKGHYILALSSALINLTPTINMADSRGWLLGQVHAGENNRARSKHWP